MTRSLALALAVALILATPVAAHHRSDHQRGPKPTPTAQPTAQPTPVTTTPTTAPTATPATGATRTVASIAALRQALADDTVTEIVVANGTYHVSPSNRFAPDSLWIGGPRTPAFDYARRTRPVLVRAETIGGVTFDGTGGGTGYAGLTFIDGAHDQTWQGFRFANMTGGSTGIIEIGGYGGSAYAAPYNITLRDITLEATVRRPTASSNQTQGIYFAHSKAPGPNNLLVDGFTVKGTDPLSVWSAIQAYHGTPTLPHSWNVTIRNGTITGTKKALALAIDQDVMHDWLLQDVTITGYVENALYWESIGAQRVVFERVRSSGGAPGSAPIYSSRGLPPPGLTLIDSDLR